MASTHTYVLNAEFSPTHELEAEFNYTHTLAATIDGS